MIAEIETDKATMEVEAVDEGVLGKILVGDGTEGVKVNAPIAVLVDAGGDGAGGRRASGAGATGSETVAAAGWPAGGREGSGSALRVNRAGAGGAQPEGHAAWSASAAPQAAPRSGNGQDAGRRTNFRVAAGAADGDAGRDRPVAR